MSSHHRNKKRSTPKTSNPFDSDYNSTGTSDVSKSQASYKRGVQFDLDVIAASRRAMISGKAPTTSVVDAVKQAGNGRSRSSNNNNTRRTTSAAARDLETGKLGTQDTASESYDMDDTRRKAKKYIDEDDDRDESGSSSGSESDSDDSSYDSIDDMKQRRKPYVYATLGVVSLLLLGGIIALSVVMFGDRSGSKSVILTARQESLHNIIKAAVPANILTDPDTPQYRANQWLLYEDSLGLAPASGDSKDRVIQRYALAAFYFSTGGPRSWKTHNWLEGDECEKEWDGVGCTSDGAVHVISLSKLILVLMGFTQVSSCEWIVVYHECFSNFVFLLISMQQITLASPEVSLPKWVFFPT